MSALINLVLSCRWFFFLSFFELHQFLRNCRHTKVHLIHSFIPFFLLFEKKNYYLGKNDKKHEHKVYKKNVFIIFKTYWIRTHGLVYIMIAKRSLTSYRTHIKDDYNCLYQPMRKIAFIRANTNLQYYHKIYLNNPNCNHMY